MADSLGAIKSRREAAVSAYNKFMQKKGKGKKKKSKSKKMFVPKAACKSSYFS